MHPAFRALAIALLLAAGPWMAPASGESVAPPAFLVGFYEMPDDAEVGGTYAGARIRQVDETLRFASVVPSDPERFLAAAHEDDRVRYVEPDAEIRALFSPNDPRYVNGEQYGPRNIGAPIAWDKTIGSTAVHVCLIDSGVLRTHEDVASARYVGGIDFVEDDADPNDGNGHGTFVTVLAVGATNNGKGIAGIAQSSWSHARVLDSAGSGTLGDGASAYRWCTDFGAHIATASIGARTTSTTLNDATTYAWTQGTLPIAAAGNDGCTPCVNTPANGPDVIAVACTTSTNDRCGISSGGPEIDIAAPGANIVSAYRTSTTSYVTGTGTSASAPLVAGVAALMKSYSPNLTAAQMRARILDTALDLGNAGWDPLYGEGLLRADLAMFNGAPSVDSLACTPTTAATSRNVTCTLTASDLDGDGIAALVDWGDGASERIPAAGFVASTATLAGVHRYGSVGDATITIVLVDDASDPAESAPVTRAVSIVPNTAPSAPTISCDPSPSTIGRAAQCSFASNDDSDGVAYLIEWGDGTSSRAPATGFVAPGASFAVPHVFTSEDLVEIVARATDDASPSLLGAPGSAIHEVRDCAYTRLGDLLAGAAGVAIDGVSRVRVSGIPAGCGRVVYTLTANGTLADIDVCWLRDGLTLRCDATPGNEEGTVPETANGADIILSQGADTTFALVIPGDFEGTPPPASDLIALIKSDDGEMDTTLDMDFTDDSAVKDLSVAVAHLAALPTKATLQVYGKAYGCGNSVAMLLTVNFAPVSAFSPCAVFPRAQMGWASFDIPVQLLLTGISNAFEIQKLPQQTFEANNLLLGVDTDARTAGSFVRENGVDIEGELMWRLVLERG